MWLPSVASIWIFDARFPGGNALNAFGGLWSHLQGLVSAVVFLRKCDVLDAVRRLPLVGRAVGALADCLPGFHRRYAAARPIGSNVSDLSDVGAGDDPQADSDGARLIMGLHPGSIGKEPPITVELACASQDAGTSLPDTTRGRAEDLASFPPQFPLASGGGALGHARLRVGSSHPHPHQTLTPHPPHSSLTPHPTSQPHP